jgi:hypothetical protein
MQIQSNKKKAIFCREGRIVKVKKGAEDSTMGIERLRHYGGMAYYGDNRNNLNNPASTCMESVNKISSDPLRNVADGAGRDEMGGLHPVNMVRFSNR